MDESYEKTLAPTPRKRAEARRRGQVARSADLVSAAVLLSAIALMQFTGPGLVSALKTFLSQSLKDPAIPASSADIFSVAALIERAMLPLLAGVIVIAIAANMLQFGFLLRWPRNEDALDIGKGCQRLFSSRSRVRLVIDLIKLVAVALVGWLLVRQCCERIVAIQQIDAGSSFAAGMEIVFGVAIRIAVLLLLLGVLDFAYQRWQHERDLRMTPREMKDELRQMQGNSGPRWARRQTALQRGGER